MNNTTLEAKVEAVNSANKYAHELYAKLVEIFRPLVGQKIDKADGGLMEKYKKLLPEFPCVPKIHVYRHASKYSLAFCVKTTAPGPTSFEYYEAVVYIGWLDNGILKEICPKFEGRTDYTSQDVIGKRKAYADAKRLSDEARDALNPFGEYDW